MKKILFAVSAIVCLWMGAVAQTTKTEKPKTTATKPAETKKPAPAPKPAAGPTKKDGTPDMRYKANKEAAKPAGPLKKDGTPDMRYKANKEAAKKKG